MKLSILFLLFSCCLILPTQCMKEKIPSQALDNSDVIKLIAYAIIDTNEPTIINSHQKVLANLRNFSATNKTIHRIMFKLRCGLNKESEKFNDYLIEHMVKGFYLADKTNPNFKCLAAAYTGTPYALNIVKKDYNRTQFKESLDAQYEIIEKYEIHDTPYPWVGSIETSEVHLERKCESLDKILSKFPPSTQQFVKLLCTE